MFSTSISAQFERYLRQIVATPFSGCKSTSSFFVVNNNALNNFLNDTQSFYTQNQIKKLIHLCRSK